MSGRGKRPIWSNLSLRTKGITIVGIPMIGLLAAAVAAIGLGARQYSEEKLVKDSIHVRSEIETVLTLLVNAETGVRGYAATGNAAFLQPFLSGRQSLSLRLGELKALVAGDMIQALLAQQVQEGTASFYETLYEVRAVDPGGGKSAATTRTGLLSQEKTQMDSLRLLLGRMAGEQNRRISAVQSGESHARTLTYIAVAASLLFGLAGGVAATTVFTRAVVTRVRRLEENAARLASGEPLLPLPPGKDEIGSVGRALLETETLLTNRDRELRESEEKFRVLAESADDIITLVRLTPTPVIEYLSPAVEGILGYTPEELISDPDLTQRVIHPEDRPLAEAFSSDPERMSGTLTLRAIAKEGRVVWLEQRTVLLRDENGTPKAIQTIARDVTERKRAEEEEHELRSFLDSVIENIPHMVFVKDARDLRFVSFNRAGEELLGSPREDLLGKNDYDFFPAEEAEFFSSKDREVLEGKRLVEIPQEPIHTSSGLRFLHTKKIPILDSNGAARYLLGISEDITDRIRAEEALRESEAQKASILASMADGTVVTDTEGTIVSINSAMERLAGWTEDEVRGRRCTDIYELRQGGSEPLSWEETLLFEAIRTGEPQASRGFGKALLTRDGRSLPVAVTTSPLLGSEGKVLGGVEVMRDVSYEREVDQLKSSLVSTVSHELRTPLTMIQGFSELLLDRDLSDDRSKEALRQIRSASERLSRLIEDLLSVSRIESGRLVANMAPVELKPVVEEVVAPFLPDRRISVGMDGVSMVLADRDKLVQILTNLVSNAVKYSPQGADIAIDARADGATVQVEVRDRGFGLSEEERSRLFEKFFRADRSEVREVGGTGLGLYITRNLVEMQGGRIWVRSEPGKGSTFAFSLPLAGSKDERAQAQ